MQLTKRTNILFDEATWGKLEATARQQSVSVGELVRQAVRDIYQFENTQAQTQTAVDTIKKIRKNHKHINYKSLINAGRSY